VFGADVVLGSARGWHRVVAEGAPRVAAQQASKAQPAAADSSMGAQRVDGVVRATRFMAAARGAAVAHPQHRGQGPLIDADEDNEEPFHGTEWAAGPRPVGRALRALPSVTTINDLGMTANIASQ